MLRDDSGWTHVSLYSLAYGSSVGACLWFHYLVFAPCRRALCIGVFGVLARRNAVGVLMGIELMLNAVNINLVAFWRYTG